MTTPAPCQRWRTGRASYRPAGEPIDPRRYGVELVDEATARAFVVGHHYSRSYPAAVCRVGLYEVAGAAGAQLVGVAVFGVPIQPAALRVHAGVEPQAGVELCRFVLLDQVPANGETWMLARAFRLLKAEKPHVHGVLAYSDPMERRTAAGDVIKPGHVGTIYRAFNGRRAGTSSPRTLLLAPDGRVVSGRMLSKLRRGDRGAAYAYRALLELGAPRRHLGEADEAYVRRALREGPWRRVRHPGNLAYTWSVKASRPAVAQLDLPGLTAPVARPAGGAA